MIGSPGIYKRRHTKFYRPALQCEVRSKAGEEFMVKMVKWIFVTGGVISGIGKGIVASSTGLILKTMGFRVTSIKIDPYLNIDAGTMSPYDHGI